MALEELAMCVLDRLVSTPADRIGALMTRHGFVSSHVNEAFRARMRRLRPGETLAFETNEAERAFPAYSQAITEAWAYLESQALLVPDALAPNLRTVSQLGQQRHTEYRKDEAAGAPAGRANDQATRRSSRASEQSVGPTPTVAVLWAHSDPEWSTEEQKNWEGSVYAFTTLLRECGIDADLDLFHSHDPTDWGRFGPSAIRTSDFVVVAVSRTWRRAWDGELRPGESAGAHGEANALHGLFADAPAEFLRRVILVRLPGVGRDSIPQQLSTASHWVLVPTLDEVGIEDLLRRLTGQPAYPKPALGRPRFLAPRHPAPPAHKGNPAELGAQLAHDIEGTERALSRLAEGSQQDLPTARARQGISERRDQLKRELEALHTPSAARTRRPADPPVFEPSASVDAFTLRMPGGPLSCHLTNTGGRSALIEAAVLSTPLGDFSGAIRSETADPLGTRAMKPVEVPIGGRLRVDFRGHALASLGQAPGPLRLRMRYRAADREELLEFRLELLRNGSDASGAPRWRSRHPATVVVADDGSAPDSESAAGPRARPDFLSQPVLEWAHEHRELLDIVAEELLESGQWPTTTDLTRKLARLGRPVPLRTLLDKMPRPLGFVENHPGRIVLLLFGLRLARGTEVILDGFVRLLRTAIERYGSEIDSPSITRRDIASANPQITRAISEIVLREAPFIGGGSGTSDDEWERSIDDGIVRYWNVHSADDYLWIRAQELGVAPPA